RARSCSSASSRRTSRQPSDATADHGMSPEVDRQPIAVIDLGSNSIRLVVYDGLSRAPVSRFNERRLCGVGREVARTGRLGAEGRTCAFESLQRFVAIARAAGCEFIDVVATAAFRTAEDGPRFVRE